MTDFQAWNHTTHPIIRLEDDWNNLLDHGLESAATYIVRLSGSYYEAIDGGTGLRAYGGSTNTGGVDGTDPDAVFQAAVTACNDPGGTVVVKDDLPIGSSITVNGPVIIAGVGREGVTLTWGGGAGHMFLLQGDCSEGFELRSINCVGTNEANSYGIYPDGVVANVKFYDVRWNNWNVAVYVDVDDTHRIIDATFWGCNWASNAVGIESTEFMTQIMGGVFNGNTIAVQLGTYTSFHAYGTIFSGNALDFYTDGTIRAIGLTGCWLENSDEILDANSGGGTTLNTFNLIDCHVHSYNVNYLIDLTGVTGAFTAVGCRFDLAHAAAIINVTSVLIQYARFDNCMEVQSGKLVGTERGVAVILNGTNSITVTHHLLSTPTHLLATAYGQNLGEVWTFNATATQFDVVCSNAPAGDCNVSWTATYP